MRARERTPYLIEREGALRHLADALDRVTTAAGSLVLVSGESGIGKTRLLEEFGARAPEARVARGGCVEGVPYAPWTEALWSLLDAADGGVLDGLPPTVRLPLARLVPSLPAAEPYSAAEDGQQLLFEAVIALLRPFAANTKLVVIVDDIHWIDPASRELLRYVASNLRRTPILLVAAYRVEDAASERELIAQLGRLADRRITLERLADDAAAEMAALLLGDDASTADVAKIVQDADGNPLFVEELVAAVDTVGVPETLRDLMLVRFTSLDDDARHFVRVAALIGARAPRAWLVHACGLDDDRARTAARAAVDAGILGADEGGGYEFRHALLRQAVLGELLPDERVALHRTIAAALLEHPESGVGFDRVAELARHWDAAEDAPSALRWLVAAGQQAHDRYAFEAAFEAYQRALVWWDVVANAPEVAGLDHAALLLDAADAAGLAGRIDRAAELARAGLDEAFALDPSRGVDAAGRVYPLMWTADRASELFEFATAKLVPVLDRVDRGARARFLVSRAEHLVSYATPGEMRGPALEMMEALDDIADPVLEARAHIVNAWNHEANGEFDGVELEYDRAAAIASRANENSMLALAVYNHAAFAESIPDFAACLKLLDTVDDLVERFGLMRYRVPAARLRALARCKQGDLVGARASLAVLNELLAEGFDAWVCATARALSDLCAGEWDEVIAELESPAVGVAIPKDYELLIDRATLRADAMAWKGDVDGARRAIDEGEAAVENHRETYWHGRLAMVGIRIEADAAVAADAAGSLDVIEQAETRAASILRAWDRAVEEVRRTTPLVSAYSCAIQAELARLRNEEAAAKARLAASAFDAISYPYYATYFRWREAEAMLRERNLAATDLLRHLRATARSYGFFGLDDAITTLARANQLRLGPGRTTVDGAEPLSERELEVLRLLADGQTNPEIAKRLFITRRTAGSHVSNILRKLGASSRAEAVSEAHRRQLL